MIELVTRPRIFSWALRIIFIYSILISRKCYHRCLEKSRKEGYKCTKGGLGQKRGSMSALGRNKLGWSNWKIQDESQQK